jgi:hypothetical protein
MPGEAPRPTCLTIAFGIALSLALGAIVPCSAADLNGFLRQKGKGDIAFSFTDEGYSSFWMGTTRVDVPNGGDVQTRSTSLWFAYGLTDDLTLTGDLPYVKTKSDGFDMEQTSLQDLTLLGEYRFAALGSGVRSSFVGAGGFRTHASDYNPNRPVDVGDGTSDILFRFVYHLEVERFYFSQQIGYDLRNEDAPDGFPLHTEAGYTLGPVTFNAFFSVLKTRGGTDIGDPGFTFPSNKEEWRRLGGKVYGRITDRFGVSAGYYETLGGRNTGDSSGFSFGVDFGF